MNANAFDDVELSNVESATRTEHHVLHVNGLSFDLTIADDKYAEGWKQLFISSRKNRPHCVFMTFRSIPYDEHNTNVLTAEKEEAPNVNLQALRFDSSCTTSDTHDMPRGIGTHSMLLGAMHAMKDLAARDAMVHLRRFVIT
ncbi:MAG: hypothetical protein ABEI52_05260, partial [Halobacteriaceae archaeon]